MRKQVSQIIMALGTRERATLAGAHCRVEGASCENRPEPVALVRVVDLGVEHDEPTVVLAVLRDTGQLTVDGLGSLYQTQGGIATDWGAGLGVATVNITQQAAAIVTQLHMGTGNARSTVNIATGGILNAQSIVAGDTTLRWRNVELGVSQLTTLREAGMTSFGSCSFTEPTSELAATCAPVPKARPTEPRVT